MSTHRPNRDHATGGSADTVDAAQLHAPGKKTRTESLAAGGAAHPGGGGALLSTPVQMKADPFDFGFLQMKGGGSSSTTTSAAAPDPFPGEKHGPAKSFAALITLIETAEKRLVAAGHDTDGVIHILRGIFYGTKWSMDNDVESSEMRNTAFQIYTASRAPDDPRPIIGQSLFAALKGSAEVKDPGGKYNDVGHMLIGLDSRSWTASHVNIPSQGGTGQAINTWLGDLGGGAGMLAMKRGLDGKVTKPAIDHFKGSDYGGVVNLEGDIAGVAGVQIKPGQTLTDALRAYLLPPKEDAGSRWNHRAQLMLESLGGTCAAGKLTNEAALVAIVAAQIRDFGCWYAATRLKDKGKSLTPDMCRNVGHHVEGAGHEMAEIFVKTLEWAMGDPKRNADATKAGITVPVTAPSTDVPYQLESIAKGLEAAKTAGDWMNDAGKWLDGQRKSWGF
ncbi:MAG TPA: hypothetical protein VM261_36260 [Kofleriaceae bacterium]|nr:hypothetical protein [Kofleriaceae bacterium]